MVLRHDHGAIPAVTRHHNQIVKKLHGFCGYGEINGPASRHFGNLHGRALVHVQRHIRIRLDKTTDNRRQCVTGLSVCCGNTQIALALVAEFLGDLFDPFCPAQNLTCFTHDNFPARGDASQMFAAPGKYFQAQLIFKKADLFGNTRLRSKKALGSCRHVEIMVRNFPYIAQLL